MAKGIDISIAADTRSAMSAINRGLIDPLEDVSEALERMGDDGQDATDDLERGMRDAQRRTDDAADEIRKLRDELNKAGRQGKNTGDDIRDGFRRAEDGAEEFKDEANSTAREAAASFDGSAESIGDAFQEIAANAFAGFGPAGALAGLAAAAGIGLAMAGFENVQAAQEESQQRAAEWADAYIEAGSRTLTFDQKAAKVRDIITDPDRYKTATDNAKLWGVSIDTAVAALAGSESAITDVTTALDAKRVASEKEARAAQQSAEANGTALLALTPAEVEYNKAKEALSLLTGEMERGAQGADVMSRYIADTARNTAGATEAIDEFGDSIITLPDGKQIYVDAETGQATENVAAIEQKIYGIPDGRSTVTVTADTSQVDREIRRLSGTTLKIGTKFVTAPGGDWQ
jgi:hypothetical protein